MQAIVFANRAGAALAPLSTRTCVALLPVVGKPLVIHALEALASAGVREAFLIVAPHADAVERELGDGARWGMRLQYVLTRGDESADEVVARVRPRLAGDFLVMRGDMLRSARLDEFLTLAAAVPGPSVEAVIAGQAAGLRLVRADAPARLDLPDDPERAAGWQPPPAVAVLAGGAVSRVASLAQYHAVNLEAAAGRFPGLIVPGRELEPGVVVGRQARVCRSALKGVSLFLGARCDVKRGAEILDGVVLSEDVVVDRGATLHNAVVLPQTYVGEGVDVSDAIVWTDDLIDVHSGAATRVTDAFLLSDLHADTLAAPLAAWMHRAAGLLLLVLSLPLWPLALVASLASDLRRPVRRVVLLGNRRVAGAADEWQREPFAAFEFATRVPLLRHLPKLLAVVRGDLRLVGVVPLTPEASAAHAEAWERLRDEAPAGLIGPAQLELSADAPPEERLIAEAFYARTRSVAVDARLLARGLGALFSGRAWGPSLDSRPA